MQIGWGQTAPEEDDELQGLSESDSRIQPRTRTKASRRQTAGQVIEFYKHCRKSTIEAIII